MSTKKHYFYIIEHIASGKMYCGCKFGKDADPENFMTEHGYKTSSNKVKSIIKDYGLSAFRVISIIVADEHISDVYDYETTFLIENNIAQDSNWLNGHNNTLYPFGSKNFVSMMNKLYGVDHCMQLDWVKKKIQQTNIERYGVSCILNTPENIQNKKDVCIERYGSINNIDKIKQTNLQRYGCEYQFQRNIVKEIIIERHGGMGNASPTIHEKCKNTNIERYGVDNYFKNPEFIKQNVERRLQRFSDPEYRKQYSAKMKESHKHLDVAGENNPFYGKTHSDEIKKRISDKNKGKVRARYCCTLCKKELGANNFTQHSRKCKQTREQ